MKNKQNEELNVVGHDALRGNITQNMRTISVSIKLKTLFFKVLFDDTPSEDDIDSSECISTEIVAGLPNITRVEEFYEVLKAGIKQPENLVIVIYQR